MAKRVKRIKKSQEFKLPEIQENDVSNINETEINDDENDPVRLNDEPLPDEKSNEGVEDSNDISSEEMHKRLNDILNDAEFSLQPEIENVVKPNEDEITPRKRKRKSINETVNDETALIIPGKLVITITDLVASRSISAIDAFLNKNGEGINPELLMLDEKYIEQLVPLADNMVKSWKLQNNPTAMFFISLGAIYSSNLVMIKALLKNQKNKNKTL